jgi:ribosomal protein S18 acetylase RimI-like enzyme
MLISHITTYSDKLYESVLRLLPQLSPGSQLPSKKYFKEILKSSNVHFFIAEVDNEIIGMLTIGTYPAPTGMKVWIEDVVVDGTRRGEGIGKDLTLFAIDYAKKMGFSEIRLTSRPTRIAANQLYVKLGFVQYETNVYKYRM